MPRDTKLIDAISSEVAFFIVVRVVIALLYSMVATLNKYQQETETKMAEQNVVGADAGRFADGEYAEYLRLKAESKQRRVSDRVKAMGSVKANTWRQRMVIRRVDLKAIVPDEDLVAYEEIYKLRNPSEDSTLKTYIADNEIAAYRALDPGFNGGVTLDAITAKVTELIEAGKLSKSSDKDGELEDGTEGGVSDPDRA